jgi:hypothetical protein
MEVGWRMLVGLDLDREPREPRDLFLVEHAPPGQVDHRPQVQAILKFAHEGGVDRESDGHERLFQRGAALSSAVATPGVDAAWRLPLTTAAKEDKLWTVSAGSRRKGAV